MGQRPSFRVLEPIERISEVLFGLIMALTFTASLSAAEAGAVEVRAMLAGTLGCNLAWGLIDAIMYLMACLADRAASQKILAAVKRSRTDKAAENVIVRALPPVLVPILDPADIGRIRAALLQLPEGTGRVGVRLEDWFGAAAVFLLVFVCTLPVVVPFAIVENAVLALRVSNAIAVAMMVVAGYAFGQAVGYRPWVMAAAMVLLGCLLVALTVLLGG